MIIVIIYLAIGAVFLAWFAQRPRFCDTLFQDMEDYWSRREKGIYFAAVLAMCVVAWPSLVAADVSDIISEWRQSHKES